MKYIAVFHHWWMNTGHFETELIEAENLYAAEIKADAIAHRKNSTFNHCRAHVLEIDDDEHLIRRNLTWGERLSGRVSGRATLAQGGGSMSNLYNEFAAQVTNQAVKLPEKTLAASALVGVAMSLLGAQFGAMAAASIIKTMMEEALKRGDL